MCVCQGVHTEPSNHLESSVSRVYIHSLELGPSLVTMPTHLTVRHHVYFNEFIFKLMFALYSLSAVYTP